MPRAAITRLLAAAAAAATTATSSLGAAQSCDWWYEQSTLGHGWSYRNVTAFGAKGDGVTDDTAAIQAAIDFQRGGDAGSNADKSAALVYIPAGDYVITDTLVLWKWTTLLGNPRTGCTPTFVLPANSPAFSGAAGLRPLIVTNSGFNISASEHAWWLEGNDRGGMTYDYFFSQIHNLNIELREGNKGAVAITWNVAQQTSLRNVSITASADTRVVLDVGASPEYEHWNAGVPYNLGGGGTVEDVSITGGQVGLRVAASQFVFRGVTIRGAATAAVQLWQLSWALSFLQLRVDSTPLGVRVDAAQGNTAFVDCEFTAVSGSTVFSTDGASPLILQNVLVNGPTPFIVDTALPGNATGGPDASFRVPLWGSGSAYFAQGTPRKDAHGVLPLPTLADAAGQGVPLLCGGGLCGGSVEAPASGIPARPRPSFSESGENVVSARTFGAVGDGVTDDTAALARALVGAASSDSVLFLPFGQYVISDTLLLPSNARLLGEGLSVIMLKDGAPGFGPPGPSGSLKPVLFVPSNATASVHIAGISLWNMGCNPGAVMLAWGAGPTSGLWDFNMLVGGTAGAKMIVLEEGAGYVSNAWLAAATAYELASAQRSVTSYLSTDARSLRRGTTSSSSSSSSSAPVGSIRIPIPSHLSAPAASTLARMRHHRTAAACVYTELGLILASKGPMFWVGLNAEHATVAEVSFLPGAGNHVIFMLETEESERALDVNGTQNVVLYNGLFAFWNASITVPAQVITQQASPSAPMQPYDLTYRLLGAAVPLPASEEALVVDVTPGGRGFVVPVVPSSNSSGMAFARTSAVLVTTRVPGE